MDKEILAKKLATIYWGGESRAWFEMTMEERQDWFKVADWVDEHYEEKKKQ